MEGVKYGGKEVGGGGGREEEGEVEGQQRREEDVGRVAGIEVWEEGGRGCSCWMWAQLADRDQGGGRASLEGDEHF